MVSIRKLLSRKFNIVCLNWAGLLARVLCATFPPKRAVVLKLPQAPTTFQSFTIELIRRSLQLREQLRIYTGFPFNHTRTQSCMNLNSIRK